MLPWVLKGKQQRKWQKPRVIVQASTFRHMKKVANDRLECNIGKDPVLVTFLSAALMALSSYFMMKRKNRRKHHQVS